MKIRCIPKIAKQWLAGLCLPLVLSFISSASAYAEPPQEYSFSTSAPAFRHWNEPEMPCSKTFLRDRFKPGPNVVLVSEKGLCTAKIVGPCTYSEFNYRNQKGSQLVADGKCPGDFKVAVVGVQPAAVRLVPAKEDKSPLSKNLESRARQVLVKSLTEQQRYSRVGYGPKLLSSSPKVLRATQAALLLFADKEPGTVPPLEHRKCTSVGCKQQDRATGGHCGSHFFLG